MTLISSVTVGSGGVSQIDFTSIPSTYDDLVLYSSLRSEGTSTIAALLRFNDSTTGYSEDEVWGTGSAATASPDSNSYGGYAVSSAKTAGVFANSMVYITNYAGSTYKSSTSDSVTENNATAVETSLMANLWSNTSAITKITLLRNGTNNFAQHSTAYLYGIKNS